MSLRNYNASSWPVYISFILTFFLIYIPSSGWISKFLPNWVLLVLLYWTVNRPNIIGLGFAWFLGLLQDILTTTFLGQHAFIYLVLVFIYQSNEEKLKNYTFIEFLPVIILFILMENVLTLMINYTLGAQLIQPSSFFSVIGAVLVWPWLYMLLNFFEMFVHESH